MRGGAHHRAGGLRGWKTTAPGAKKLQQKKKSTFSVEVEETEEVKAARDEFQRAYNKAARRTA